MSDLKRVHISTYGGEPILDLRGNPSGLATKRRWVLHFDNVFIADTSAEGNYHKWLELEELVDGGRQAKLDVRSGDRFVWKGLPASGRRIGRDVGQYDPERVIIVDSMTATCAINARIVSADGDSGLCTIPMADFVTAIEQGWLEWEVTAL